MNPSHTFCRPSLPKLVARCSGSLLSLKGCFGVLILGVGFSVPHCYAFEKGTLDEFHAKLKGPASFQRNNDAMRRLVGPLANRIGKSTTQIYCGGKLVALGVVVARDGYVLTKHSELTSDPIRVRLADGRLLPGRLAAVRRASDLALIEIPSEDKVPAITFSSKEPEIASFLISVGRGRHVVGIGVLSIRSRRIDHKGRLGVILYTDSSGRARVRQVMPNSGADSAGIKRGDQIMAIDGKNVPGRARVIKVLRKRFPGENVRLTILRDGGEVELEVRIREMALMQESRSDLRVNGARNERLAGFEKGFQHDTVLEPHQCGGPLLNTSGQVVGINIARAGRVASYALPSSLIRLRLPEMLREARAAKTRQSVVKTTP